MKYQLLTEKDFKVSSWTGGKTKELAIFPEDGNYLERRFIWRLSSATCELAESDFSKLPDFDRVLMVLKGQVVLAHEGVRMAKLAEYEQDSFDGAYKTKSFGQITDYNLMVAKGGRGFLEAVEAKADSESMRLDDFEDYKDKTMGLFVAEGFATVTVGGETLMAACGSQLVVNAKAGENVEVSMMGEGKCVVSRIYYSYAREEFGPVEIPAEKASFDDFKKCFYLANTSFRGANFIFKNKKNEWLDEALKKAIRKIDGFYLTYIVYVIGAIAALTLTKDASAGSIALWLAIWTLIDFVLVSPLMYMLVVPKPVGKHIKDVDKLTPYEQQVYEREMNTNERVEKLMKKYKAPEDRAGK